MQQWVFIIFFVYNDRFVFCEGRGLHFYMNDIRDRNVNLPIDSNWKNFALKSRCTLLDSIESLTTFREGYIDEFYIILFVYCSRFFCCNDLGLHFYMNDIRDRNVNLPIDSKCKNFALKSRFTLPDSIENVSNFQETRSDKVYIIFFVYCSRFVSYKDCGLRLCVNDIRGPI